MNLRIHRRRFLRDAAGLTALSATVPAFLQKTGWALAGEPRRDIAPIPGLNDDRVLVVIQLAGGNDGLNTLVPHADDAYHRARPTLGVKPKDVLKIDDAFGFHPQMAEANLDSAGDPIHAIDFRSVYAAVLQDWLGADAGRVLQRRFEAFPVLQ